MEVSPRRKVNCGVSLRLLTPKPRGVVARRIFEAKQGKLGKKEKEDKRCDHKAELILMTLSPDKRQLEYLEVLKERRIASVQASREEWQKMIARKKAAHRKVTLIGQCIRDIKARNLVNREEDVSEEEEHNELFTRCTSAKSSDRSPLWKLPVLATELDENYLDRERWCRINGIPSNTNIFVCSRAYPAVRAALLKRGWFENRNEKSRFWDFYFTMRLKKVPNIHYLKEDQILNRFLKSSELCSKNRLLRNLKNLKWFLDLNYLDFFPRAYCVYGYSGHNPVQGCMSPSSAADSSEMDKFILDFKITSIENLLKLFLHKMKSVCHSVVFQEFQVEVITENNVSSSSLVLRECGDRMKDVILKCINILKEYYLTLRDVWRGYGYVEKLLTALWADISTQTRQLSLLPKASKLFMFPKQNELTQCIENVLESNPRKQSHQYLINGFPGKNIWIVKPAGKSRGRGIRCFNDLEKVLEFTSHKNGLCRGSGGAWIIQKYIENALIIHNRKFDIRQWALVTSWNPLMIWMYNDCYLRFCVNEFSLDERTLDDCFTHLANNAVSSKSKHFNATGIDGNMWTKEQFIDYLERMKGSRKLGEAAWEHIQRQITVIIESSMSCVQDMIEARKNSFEVYGFDFMVDENFNVYLLEVNSSPSMEYSTNITRQMVERALTGLVSCVLDGKYKSSGLRKFMDNKLKLKKYLNQASRGVIIEGWQLIVNSRQVRLGPASLALATANALTIKGKRVKGGKKRKKTRRISNVRFTFDVQNNRNRLNNTNNCDNTS